jgi:lipoprotein-anchoring transpeptidase ErfK/SrfK
MRRVRLASMVVSVAVALPVVATAGASARSGSLHETGVGVTTLLTLHRQVDARVAPDSNAHVVATLPVATPLTKAPMTLPVLQTAGSGNGEWVRVRLPMRPDGATGWVPADAGSGASTPWEIVIHRSKRRAVVFHDGTAQESFSVIVGKRSTPTPLGTFFVVEKLHLAPGVAEGPWALATSAYSDVLRNFDGGDGQVALHGTTGLTGQLGTFASHGCIRFEPAAITWIANRVGPGTPVIIKG